MKEKPRLVKTGGTCSKRDLVDEGLDQNKVLYSLLRVKLLIVNYHAGSLTLPALGRQISGYLSVSGFRTTLTRISLCRFFLVALLNVFLSAFYRLSSFSLCGELDCWLGHG